MGVPTGVIPVICGGCCPEPAAEVETVETNCFDCGAVAKRWLIEGGLFDGTIIEWNPTNSNGVCAGNCCWDWYSDSGTTICGFSGNNQFVGMGLFGGGMRINAGSDDPFGIGCVWDIDGEFNCTGENTFSSPFGTGCTAMECGDPIKAIPLDADGNPVYDE